MEAKCSSETRLTRRYIPEGGALHGALMFRQVNPKGFRGRIEVFPELETEGFS
jgi:hypothetical protein